MNIRDGEEEDFLFPSIYGVQLTYSALAKSITKYNRDRGVHRVSIHAFRHTFAKH